MFNIVFNNECKCRLNHHGRHGERLIVGRGANALCDRECEICLKVRIISQPVLLVHLATNLRECVQSSHHTNLFQS